MSSIKNLTFKIVYYSMTDASSESTLPLSLEACLEAILFVAASPVPVAQLAQALGRPLEAVEQAIANLEVQLAQGRGISLQRHEGKIQITTAPMLASIIENYLGLEATARLSRAALETLAIIAYRQPVTRPGIDAIRGVNSDGVLKSLLSKGLVQEMGRAEGPGRPILYGTTTEFLQHFGLSSLGQMPPYELPETPDEERNVILKD